jgi:peptidoglycan/xylan/chitin deacetylase (PgdA/CDA1 family)
MKAASSLRVPVLMYHEIADAARTTSRFAVSPGAFAAQLAYLRDTGYTPLTAGALSAILADGIGKLPERPVVLTFDDGYEDFHSQAMPLLDQYGFTATLFMTSGWLAEAGRQRDGMRPMLSWPQLAEAAHAGIEIGAHSSQHPELDQLPENLLREELHSSKSLLEDELGMSVPGLAYPYGYSNAKVRQVAREAGYAYAYAVGNTIATEKSGSFTLPRLTVQRATTLDSFSRIVSGHDTMMLQRDRVLTKGWAVVRRSKATLRAARGVLHRPGQ